MEYETWLITIVAFAGTVLNAYKKRSGFILWLISNVFWVGYNIHTGVYAQAALFALNSVMCVVGLVQWKKEKSSTEGRKKDET